MSVLYITQDGVTDHIGQSQIVPYILGLAKEGYFIHILSAEKIGRNALIEQYQSLFDAAGIRWTRVRYRNKPPVFGQLLTQIKMKRLAKKISRNESVRLIHGRSFPATMIAYQLKRVMDIKYIFDFRDFYADGGLKKRRGLARLVFKRLKQLEGPMIRSADKVVCLTKRAREVLSNDYLQDVVNHMDHFQVIPCCADFDLFDPSKITSQQISDARATAELDSDAFVLLYLGSLGPDYLLAEMLAFFKSLLMIKSNAYFLFVSNNGIELVHEQCRVQGIPLARIRFISVARDQVPSFIMLADLSVVFIRPDRSKLGCSPTKIAELFACNVPVIANIGVGDLDEILQLERNGSFVIQDFSDDSFRLATEKICAIKQNNKLSIRDASIEFSLEEGIKRYSEVYKSLL